MAVSITRFLHAQQPAPDLPTLLAHVRENLRTDETLLAQYTYKVADTRIELDGKGRPTKTTVEVSEIYPPLGDGGPYRRRIAVNGVPVKREELEKQDRERRNDVLKYVEKRKRETADQRAKRLQRKQEERRKERRIIDETFALYDFALAGQEVVEGRAMTIVAFTPRPGASASSREAKIMRSVKGRIWVSDDDYQVARLEMEAVRDITIGWGLFARLHKGTHGDFTRRKINNEIWLPAEARLWASGRFLLFKRLRAELRGEYSDYRKFSVETDTSFTLQKPPGP